MGVMDDDIADFRKAKAKGFKFLVNLHIPMEHLGVPVFKIVSGNGPADPARPQNTIFSSIFQYSI